jgi:hypothetical protein
MARQRPQRRLPLRDLLTDAEKRTRDLVEHITTTWLDRIADLRDLSRPHRRKSHFPTINTLLHSVDKVVETTQQTEDLIDYLSQELEEIHEHAQREKLSR